jgi:protein involved in polysaccharide export with SLBB domain
MVSVFGNVYFPGSYPLTKDMMLSDAIKAAGGQKDRTYYAEVELNRRDKLGKRFSTNNTISDIEEAKEINLQPMDVINLKQVASTLKTVEIRGEVFFPGLYPISQYQTLGQVLKRAGGLTENGSAEAAYFQRFSLKEAEAKRIQAAQGALKRKIILSSTAGSDGLGEDALETSAVDELIKLIATDEIELEVLGRLVIDLQGIINGDIEDIILDDGDVINIPKKKQSVSVIGEVFVANNHIYDKYLSIDDYINLSGGTTTFADTDNIYVIKSDGSIISPNQLSSGFFRGKNNNIRAGDTVVVPLEIDSFSNVRAANEITQIIYQMAVAAAAVNSF